jgi:hypothetical protein
VTVTSGGDPVNGARVTVDGDVIGYTNATGQVSFEGCGKEVAIHTSKTGYAPDDKYAGLVSCGQCVACTTDADCPSTESCEEGQCVLVSCSCGAVQNHACMAYACCSNSDCPAGESCVENKCKPEGCTSDEQCGGSESCSIPPGQSAGSCKEIIGCGKAQNHTLVPYECGSEVGCRACPSGKQCTDHKCVLKSDVSCPSTGIVGDDKLCSISDEGQACTNCDYTITAPDGKKYAGKTDEDGNFELPLDLEGTYKVDFMKDGKPVAGVEVKAFPKSTPEEPEKPTSAESPLGNLLWLIILILLILIGLVYWKSKKGKK